MDSQAFDALFDSFKYSAFRLETLQHYAVAAEDARLTAFREGLPRPERSTRTSPWLRRIAATTVEGKSWSRVHIVEHPLSEYLRYELVSYVESQAVGERISVADRAPHPELAGLRADFWLFDAGTDSAHAVLMHYDQGGAVVGREAVHDLDAVRGLDAARRLAEQYALPLNDYLACGV